MTPYYCGIRAPEDARTQVNYRLQSAPYRNNTAGCVVNKETNSSLVQDSREVLLPEVEGFSTTFNGSLVRGLENDILTDTNVNVRLVDNYTHWTTDFHIFDCSFRFG